MSEKSIIIIGAGIGGLATGVYARLNGYNVKIYEKHTLPGGACTAWKRKGYLFDGCIHHLAGSTPGCRVYRMWEELGVMPCPIHVPDDLICIEDADGTRFTVHTDIERLEQHMLELAPADAAVIREFTQAARRFTGFNLMEMVLAKPWEMLALLPNLGLMGKWGKITLEQYAQRFSNPLLRRAFPMIQYDFANIPAIVALMFLSGVHTRYFGYPAGGALQFAQGIAQRLCQLGGEITYKTSVEKVLVENDRAVGVRLQDGSEQRADYIISNADGRTTIYDMLDGKYVNEQIRSYYANPPQQQEMGLNIYLGVARDLKDEPHALVLCLPEAVTVAGMTCDRLDLEFYAFAPETAPQGKCVVKATLNGSYQFWKALRDQGEESYKAEKQRAADTVITCLERRYPGLAAQVETVDVATPLTVERFIGSYRGYQSWPVPNQSIIDALSGKGLSRTLPGLTNFYMVGQWAGGLGLPNVAAMGRKTVAAICKRDRRRFRTGLPAK